MNLKTWTVCAQRKLKCFFLLKSTLNSTTMLLQTFKLYEIVQILDPETYIWESAKIIAFVSDWSLKIQWIDWNNRLQKIEFSLEMRPDLNRWNIRKARHSQPVMSIKRSKPLSYNSNRLQKKRACDLVATRLWVCGALFYWFPWKIETGTISTNDPFTHECVVEINKMSRFIPYCYLKNSMEDTHVHDEKAEDDEETEETRQEHREEPKQKRPKTQIPEIDFSALIPQTDVDVKLGFLPCVNGICHRGSNITLSGMEFKMKDLYYSS